MYTHIGCGPCPMSCSLPRMCQPQCPWKIASCLPLLCQCHVTFWLFKVADGQQDLGLRKPATAFNSEDERNGKEKCVWVRALVAGRPSTWLLSSYTPGTGQQAMMASRWMCGQAAYSWSWCCWELSRMITSRIQIQTQQQLMKKSGDPLPHQNRYVKDQRNIEFFKAHNTSCLIIEVQLLKQKWTFKRRLSV